MSGHELSQSTSPILFHDKPCGTCPRLEDVEKRLSRAKNTVETRDHDHVTALMVAARTGQQVRNPVVDQNSHSLQDGGTTLSSTLDDVTAPAFSSQGFPSTCSPGRP
jgi:hypothetical protein